MIVNHEGKEVDICINDICEYMYNKLSDVEKHELVEYVCNKPKPDASEEEINEYLNLQKAEKLKEVQDRNDIHDISDT